MRTRQKLVHTFLLLNIILFLTIEMCMDAVQIVYYSLNKDTTVLHVIVVSWVANDRQFIWQISA